MSIDLSRYNSQELRQLQKDIDRALEGRRKKEAKQAREELKAVATKYGMNLDDLIRSGKVKGSGAGAPYQHPQDPSKTWSGRGRKPGWLKEFEAQGGTLDELATDR